MKIGEIITAKGEIILNAGKTCVELEVRNGGKRPVQVGSHFHFAEANPALIFDREKAYGYRLDIPAGTAVRFEGGEHKKVQLVAIGGARKVMGLSGAVDGYLDGERRKGE